MLELLKNNNTIEKVYADVAKDGEYVCSNWLAIYGTCSLLHCVT